MRAIRSPTRVSIGAAASVYGASSASTSVPHEEATHNTARQRPALISLPTRSTLPFSASTDSSSCRRGRAELLRGELTARAGGGGRLELTSSRGRMLRARPYEYYLEVLS